MFFKFHGNTQYNIFGTEFPLTDITKVSLSFDKSKVSMRSINVDSRTPEQVADDLYNDPELYWTVLFANNIVDPFLEWFMMEDQLYEYCERIYGGEEGMMKVRYFRDTYTSEIITGDDVEKFQDMMDNDILLPENIEYVTHYAYEQLKNAGKQMIKIIPPELITRFVEDFKQSLKGK